MFDQRRVGGFEPVIGAASGKAIDRKRIRNVKDAAIESR